MLYFAHPYPLQYPRRREGAILQALRVLGGGGLLWAPLSTAVPRGALALPRTLPAPGSGWLCSFGVFPVYVSVCLSVFFACSGDQPLYKSRSPDCPPQVPGPHGSAQPPARDTTTGPEPWMQPTGWVPSTASPPHPPGKGDLQPQLDSALQDVNDMYLLLEETEKQAVRRALIEERGRFCTFITFLQPVVVGPWGGVA